jgi:hypothetical protein
MSHLEVVLLNHPKRHGSEIIDQHILGQGIK